MFPDTPVYSLREEVEAQLGYDVVPQEYVFLRSVGRALTRVSKRKTPNLHDICTSGNLEIISRVE